MFDAVTPPPPPPRPRLLADKREMGINPAVLIPGALQSPGGAFKMLMPGSTPRDSDVIGLRCCLGVGTF